ncbi:MAG: hypothetical protein WKG07_10720 [Hymenobacter sp.]
MNEPAAKEFDACLLFYHAEINDPTLPQQVEYFYHLKDFKYRMLHALLYYGGARSYWKSTIIFTLLMMT